MPSIDDFYQIGATDVARLQNAFPESEKLFSTVTVVADPAYTFSILIPLFAFLSPRLSCDVLIVTIMAEWSNILLKWLLKEDRPYWWVKERELLTKYPVPVFRQTPLTCETGPGSPSGHMMGSAAVLFAIMQFINDSISQHARFSEVFARRVRLLLWILFAGIELLIGASRVYLAAHFPHQCVIGVISGIFIAHLFLCHPNVSPWWRYSRTPKLLLAAVGMLLISFGSYWLQKGLGIDPQWSVKMAFKWCATPEWIHVNTTPLFSLVRVSGAAYGLAMIAPVVARQTRSGQSVSYLVKGVLICSLIIIMHYAQAAVPTDHRVTFYLCMFMLYAVQPYIYIVVVPFLASQQYAFIGPLLELNTD